MADFIAPDRIYLQPHMAPEVTWCEDQTDETDVEYVRADIVDEDLVERVADWINAVIGVGHFSGDDVRRIITGGEEHRG